MKKMVLIGILIIIGLVIASLFLTGDKTDRDVKKALKNTNDETILMELVKKKEGEIKRAKNEKNQEEIKEAIGEYTIIVKTYEKAVEKDEEKSHKMLLRVQKMSELELKSDEFDVFFEELANRYFARFVPITG